MHVEICLAEPLAERDLHYLAAWGTGDQLDHSHALVEAAAHKKQKTSAAADDTYAIVPVAVHGAGPAAPVVPGTGSAMQTRSRTRARCSIGEHLVEIVRRCNFDMLKDELVNQILRHCFTTCRLMHARLSQVCNLWRKKPLVHNSRYAALCDGRAVVLFIRGYVWRRGPS